MLTVGLGSVKGDYAEKKNVVRKGEVFWCKKFQKKICKEKSPHLAQLKQDEPPVPVVHPCAVCLQKDGRMLEHSEVDCPEKKGM